jgi:hypothetical protein
MLNGGTNGRIAAVGAVRSVQGLLGWNRRKDGSDVLHAFGKSHVVVPFVANLEGMDPAGDGMHGELREFGVPMRIHAPEGFEIATGPLQPGFTRIAPGDLHTVMAGAEAHPLGHEFAKFLEALGANGRMPVAAVAINEDGRRVVKGAIVGGPSVAMNLGPDPRVVGSVWKPAMCSRRDVRVRRDRG